MASPDKDTITKIREIRGKVKANMRNPVALAELLIELATYNADLGDYLGEVKFSYEKKRGEIYKKNLALSSNAQAENIARADLADYRGRIQQVEILHKDVARLMSGIQSRLRSLDNESKNTY